MISGFANAAQAIKAARGARAASNSLRRQRALSRLKPRQAAAASTPLPPPDRGFGAEVGGLIRPHNPGEWAMELGPDLLGGLAATAYAGPIAGVEDLALGVGGSFGGRFAGGALMYGLAKMRGVSPDVMRQMVGQGIGAGGFAGGFGLSMFGPRPFTEAQRRQQEEEYLNQQALEQHRLLGMAAGSPTLQNYDALLSQLVGVN